jgi:hypothetical protein
MRAMWLMRVIVRVLMLVLMSMFIVMGLRCGLLCSLSIDQHVDFRRIDSAAVNFTQVQRHLEMERVDRLLQRYKRDPGVYQRSEKHIAADAGEAFEIRDLHILQEVRAG